MLNKERKKRFEHDKLFFYVATDCQDDINLVKKKDTCSHFSSALEVCKNGSCVFTKKSNDTDNNTFNIDFMAN